MWLMLSLGVPLQPHVRLSKDDCPKDDDAANYMKNVPYASACGSLKYVMVANRPNIAHLVGVVSRFMANIGRANCEAIKSILRYLKGTKGKCLCYAKVPLELKDFVIQTWQVMSIHASSRVAMYTPLQVELFLGDLDFIG